jgi:hypothetical protein
MRRSTLASAAVALAPLLVIAYLCEMRILGVVFSCLFGVGLPAFLLGPWVFNGVPFHLLPNAGILVAAASALFGLWLLAVSFVATTADLEKIIEPFEAAEGVVFFLPRMLVVGTISIWRWLTSPRRRGAE